MSPAKSTNLLLKSLKEEGIQEVYVSRTPQKNQQTVLAPPVVNVEGSSTKDALLKLRSVVLPCTLCTELASRRKNVVFGAGNSKAKLMFIGEAPGADEDEQGLPFVGRAGQLLTKIIESIQLKREDVFIANVLKCRPPGNRPPKPDEIVNCKPYLLQQIDIISPKIICALGTFAAQAILETETSIGKLRGSFHEMGKYKVVCTYHPAYLLRNPNDKGLVWEDMKMIRKELQSL